MSAEEQFEQKLASAGVAFEKIATEYGLKVSDFTETEINDILTTLMDGGTPVPADKTASAPAPAAPAPSAPPPVADKTASAPEPKLTYGQVMSEVLKFAQANNVDLTKETPEAIDAAVQKMAAFLSDPEAQKKQAALNEKYAEADAMGRVMAHAYVDELGKIASSTTAEKTEDEKKKEEEAEKKAALVRHLASGKTAGEMPEAFKKHLKGKDEGDDKSKDESKKDEDEKKEAAAKIAAAAEILAMEKLILAGTDPSTGAKFASEEAQVEAAANLLLAKKGYR